MQLKTCVVEFLSADAKHMTGAKDGRSWDFWSQTGVVYRGRLAFEAEFQFDSGDQVYPAGFYVIGADSIIQRAVTSASGRARIVPQFESNGRLVPLADAVAELTGLLKDQRGSAAAPAPARAA